MLVLQVDVAFLSDQEISLAEFLLVGVELLFEERDVSTGMFFSHFAKLSLVLVLQLSLLVAKVLLLSLNDDVELGLLTLDLLDKFLKVGNLLEVLDLLRGDFLVEQVLLFLVSDLVLKFALANELSFRMDLIALALLRKMVDHVGIGLCGIGHTVVAWAIGQKSSCKIVSTAKSGLKRQDVSVVHVSALTVGIRDAVAVFQHVHVIV